MGPKVAKKTKFDRDFDPEYVAARKDISPAMLASARGDLAMVLKIFEDISKDGDWMVDMEVKKVNREGNNCLLMAVANGYADVANFLLEAKADIAHKNGDTMDALDFATMDGVRTNIAKTVLRHCDYVVPEALDGKFWQKSAFALGAIVENKAPSGTKVARPEVALARVKLLGKLPDFSDIFKKETEYRADWVRELNFMVEQVKRGFLLLDSDIGYLERDAMLCGSLEVPVERRFIWLPWEKKVVKFNVGLRTPNIYADSMERRIMEACNDGDAMAVQSLLKAKGHPNVEDVMGRTALMGASKKGDPVVMRCLLIAKAHVNATNQDGFSALHLASVHGNLEACRLLLRAKTDLDKRSFKGNSVFDFVQHEGQKEVLALLNQHREALRMVAQHNSAKRSSSRRGSGGGGGGMFSMFMPGSRR